MKKISLKSILSSVVALTMVFSLVGGTVANAAALTSSQISAIVSLLQSFGADATTVANVTASLTGQPVTSAPASSGYSFTRNLTLGSTGADVTALQQILVGSGDLVMPTGVAYGYFGSLTQSALAKYQLAKGIAPAVGYFGPITIASLSSMTTETGSTGTVVNVTGTDLKVSLAPTSPTAGAVVAGQAIANLAEFTFTNTSGNPAVVTNVTLQRTGISNDTALSNVYLYNGVNRLTDAASVSSGKIAFNAPVGLFTVPAGSSITVSVRSDILTGTSNNGQILIVSLTGVTASIPVSAVYPISGASQQISSADLAGVTVATSSVSTTDIDPQDDYTMYYATLNVSTNDVWMKAISLRQVGSVSTGDLSNFKLYVDGNQVGPTLGAYDANGYLTFDLSANPIKLMTGAHNVKLVGDIIGGSTKNFSFSLRQASDLNLTDSQLNVNITPTGLNGSFPLTTGVQTINAGTVTITKATDSPSGNVTLLASGVTSAKFLVKAQGEPVKIETLNVKFAGSSVGPIRNTALFANGAQIGSTADLASSSAGTTFNLGSSLVVYPGTPVTLEVRSDIYTSSGTQLVNGDTFTVSLVAGSSNANLQKSLGYISTTAVSANQMTVSQGSLSLSKYNAYANQSKAAPQTAFKLGQYTLTAGTTEDINLNTITVNFANSSTTISKVTDVYVVYGSKTTSNKSTVASGDNSFAVSQLLSAGQTIDVAIYGTIASDIGASDTVTTKLSISGITSGSNQTVTIPSSSYTVGQTMSITTGVLNLAVYSLPADVNVVAGGQVKAGSFQFVATGDSFTIDELVGFIPFAAAGNVSGVVYKIGGTTLNPGTSIDTSDGSNALATTTGLNIVVPANDSNGVIVDAYLNLASIGTPGAATSSSNVKFTLDGYRKMSSTGVQSDIGGQAKAGNNQYAYNSMPTITNVALPESGVGSLSAGTKTLSRIQISADSSGAIDWSEINWTITKAAAVTLGPSMSDWSLTDDAGNTIAGAFSSSTNLGAGVVTTGNVQFIATNPETIAAGASKIYRLKTTVGGTIATNDAVSAKVPSSGLAHVQSTELATVAGTTASFIWSDRSYSPHSATAPSWNNDNLVKNIATDSQTISN